MMETSLSAEDLILAKNTRAVATVQYTGNILDYTVEALKAMNKKTRKS